MHSTIRSWDEFKIAWNGLRNFMMAGECVPFSYDFPPIAQVVEELRRHPESSVGPGIKGKSLNLDSIKAKFQELALKDALASPFSLAHYHLSEFDAPGKCLHGFKEQVLRPWQDTLQAQGFTWTRCYPIIFISGANCTTNYHMDFSHVLAWQIYGHKRFCGLKDPNRWTSREIRVQYSPSKLTMPAEISPKDTLCYDMSPGDALWNALLTPHWVEASAEVAMSINISHGGLRYHGQLAPNEQELMEWCEAHPTQAPQLPTGRY